MGKSIFKQSFYVDAYEYARSGLKNKTIAKMLGVSEATLNGWISKKPAFKDAIDRGRNAPTDAREALGEWHDFVYKRLPPELQDLWDEIQALDNEPNGIRRMEALLQDAGKRARQHLFLYALTTSNFNVSKALRSVNISRKTFESWVTSEPEFSDLMDQINKAKGDFFEDALLKSVKRGEVPSIIFANKTFNRNRGYGEKVDVKVDGQVEHSHTHEVSVVAIDDLNLPLDVKRTMLEALREQKAKRLALEAEHDITSVT